MEEEIFKEVVKSPGLLKEMYFDIVQPGAKQVGKALNTVVGLGNTVLLPLQLINEKSQAIFEKNTKKYQQKLNETPEEEICEVSPEIGVPIVEKFSYISNEELSNMYTELLASASKKDKVNTAHPSFVNIINNLSPDEAKVLKFLKSNDRIPFYVVKLKYIDENKGYHTLNRMFFRMKCLADLTFPDNIHSYIDNLEGLALIKTSSTIFMVGENVYEPLEKLANDSYKQYVTDDKLHKLELDKGKMEVTPFGKLFMEASIQ